jgi:hypothetical protein
MAMTEITRNAPDIPSENGKRASIDSATGEVHGSGVGAGGGSPGEDYDNDSASGDGPVPLPGEPIGAGQTSGKGA